MQVVSQADAQGRVRVVALSEIQGQRFEQPAIVIAETVGGMEDIPVYLLADTCDIHSTCKIPCWIGTLSTGLLPSTVWSVRIL